jgi:hypothetical protein
MMRAALLLLFPLSLAGAQAEWAVSPKPIVDVTGVDASGGVVFQNLAGGTRLSNGNLLVVDKGAMSIRLIDSKGKLLKTEGRQGQGPGEYQILISGSGCGGDSLLVWARESMVMVGPNGLAARQFKMPPEGTRMMPLMNITCGGSGNLVYLTQPLGRPTMGANGSMFMTSAVATVDRSGKLIRTVDSVPSGEWMRAGNGAFPRPLAPTTSAVAVGDRVVVGVADSGRAWVFTADGKHSVINIPWTPRPATPEEFKMAVAAVAEMAPVQVRPAVEPEIAKAPKPASLPAYFNLYGDPDGVLWVQQSPPGAKRTDLLAMSVEGKVLARTIIPMAVRILEIGRDYILASYDDANDETHLAVFSLKKR